MRLNAADGRDATLQWIVGGTLETDRAGLGHAVCDGNLTHVHLVVDALHHLYRARRAGHDSGPQRRQVEFFEFGVIQLGNEHCRDAVERRAFFGFYRFERRERIEAFAGIDHGGAMGDGREIAHHHAEAMIERHRDADAVRRRQPHRASDKIAVVEDIMVGQRNALRRTGRAAGKLDVDRIVELKFARQRA